MTNPTTEWWIMLETLTNYAYNDDEWWWRVKFVTHVFLNVFNHMYAILKNCYLFHCLSMPCPALLRFRMEKNFFLPHDFKAWMCKLSRKVFSSPINCLQMVAFNCFHLPSRHRRYSTCVSRDIFTMPHSRLLLFWPIPTIPAFVCLLPIRTSTSVDLNEYSVKSRTPEMSANSCS